MTYTPYIKLISIIITLIVITIFVLIIIAFKHKKKNIQNIEKDIQKNTVEQYKIFNKCYQSEESKLHAFVDNASKCNRILEDHLINQGLPKQYSYKDCVELCRQDDKCVGGKYITDGKNKGLCYISSKLQTDSNKFDHFDEPTIAFSLDKPQYTRCVQLATSEESAMYAIEPKCNRFADLSYVGKLESNELCENKCKEDDKCLGGIYYTSGDEIKKCYLGLKYKDSETEYSWLKNSGNVFFN